ncbi:MAG: Rpn family recombination-promoting nuclease/putative transposase [Planctomycetes bacterium]|nr:Rpn family recombination-promoting nuclease/putative transposase [Planctomycetota bacterium]
MATPHDDLFRYLTGHVRHAAAWLRSVVPAAVGDTIDWSSLRPASEILQDERSRAHRLDRVHGAVHIGTRSPAWLLGEHKAFDDSGAYDQVLRYAALLRNLAPGEGHSPPIPVLAVVLHHGDEPFAGRTADEWLDEYQPRIRLVVDDLATQDEAAILARDLTALDKVCFLCMNTLPGACNDAALAALDRWAGLLRATDREDGPAFGEAAVQRITGYVLMTSEADAALLHAAVERILQRSEFTIMSTAEKLKNQGMAEGITQGITQGITRGRAEALLRLLTKRFGALPTPLAARLHEAPLADLDLWTDRILDARSLAEVFEHAR